MRRRQRLVDTWVVAVALVVGFVFFSNQARQGDWPPWAEAAGTIGGLAACGALWFRRRWPVGVALCILPVAVFSSFAAPAGFIAFFTVAVERRFAVVAWLGGTSVTVLCVGFAVASGGRPETPPDLWL